MQSIILLHGALGSSDELQPLSMALRAKGLATYAFSFAGHGKQKFNDSFGIEAFANELDVFIKTNKLQKPSLFGYSMGGYVALNYALQHGSLINKIITLGTKFKWTFETLEKETSMLDPQVIVEKAPSFANSLESKHGHAWKELVTKTAEMIREITEKQFLNDSSLKTIPNPVLVGKGDRDSLVSLEETEKVFKTLLNPQLYILPQTKHPVNTVKPELLALLIANFIAMD